MSYIPIPPRKPAHVPFWWEEFLEIEVAPFGMRSRGKLLLLDKELGKYVAAGGSIMELNDKAKQYLDKKFEEIVLA